VLEQPARRGAGVDDPPVVIEHGHRRFDLVEAQVDCVLALLDRAPHVTLTKQPRCQPRPT